MQETKIKLENLNIIYGKDLQALSQMKKKNNKRISGFSYYLTSMIKIVLSLELVFTETVFLNILWILVLK